MKRYCVLGSVNMDMVTRVSRFPKPGETVDGVSFATFPGGKGANQAVALGRLGAKVVMAARIGDDAFGDLYRRIFSTEGVDASATETMRGRSVDADFVERKRSTIEQSDFILLQLEVPLEAVLLAARIARDAGRTVILDPAPARPLPKELLALVDYATPNETEAMILTGVDSSTEDGIRKAGECLLQSGVKTAIIKAGGPGRVRHSAHAFRADPRVHGAHRRHDCCRGRVQRGVRLRPRQRPASSRGRPVR